MSKKLAWTLVGVAILALGILTLNSVKQSEPKTDSEHPAGNQLVKSPTGNEPKPGVGNRIDTLLEETQITTEIDTSVWQTYKNPNQGFQIKLPPLGRWHQDIRVDEHTENDSDAFFDALFSFEKENDVFFIMRKNLFSEITPFLPSGTFCQKKQEVTLWNDVKITQIMYSKYETKNGIVVKECELVPDVLLSDEHSVQIRFCLNKNMEINPADLVEQIGYICPEDMSLYYFSLFCNGQNWKGKEGQNKCSTLFNKIVSTFKFNEEG